MEQNSDRYHRIALGRGLMTLIHVILSEAEEYHVTQKWFFIINQNSLPNFS